MEYLNAKPLSIADTEFLVALTRVYAKTDDFYAWLAEDLKIVLEKKQEELNESRS